MNNNQKVKITLACKDTLNDTNCFQNYKKQIERLNYIVENNDDNPDFILYDVFGCQHAQKQYNKSVKIALYSENIIPDFSEADYSLGQAHITYLDRYFKYPSFIYSLNLFKKYSVRNIESFAKNKLKTKFCGAVISNYHNFTLFRLEFIKKLNEYKTVDMGGTYGNNIGKRVNDKIEFLSSYKFSISMENSNGDGYISEKIVDSFIAGTIPIYYGDYLIDEYINPKVYILIKGDNDIQDKIEYIKKIDNDNRLYRSILKEKILVNDNFKDIIKKVEKDKIKFWKNIFSRNLLKLKRIDDINSNYQCDLKYGQEEDF